MDERRRDPRLNHNIPIRIMQGGVDVALTTENISRSGAYCRVSAYIEPMTKLKLNFTLPQDSEGKTKSKKISCEGVVVRTEEFSPESSYNIAIFFSDISPKDSKLLTEYVTAGFGQEA